MSKRQTPPQPFFKVGTLTAQTGITRQAVHQYVLMGILAPEDESTGGQKWYSAASIRRIELIKTLQRAGNTLASIRDQLKGVAAG